VVEVLNKDFGPAEPGGNFLEHFLSRTERYKTSIKVHAGVFSINLGAAERLSFCSWMSANQQN
jgi:hypothetical protein